MTKNNHTPIIQLRDVVKAYETGEGPFLALKDVTIDIQPGEFLGITGKSGAGKTTLLNMISGVSDLTSGEVLFHVRGPRDEEFRVVPMSRLDGDDFAVSVPFGGGTDDWLVYYVEATDRIGNGPGTNGSAEEPFHAFPAETERALQRGHS